MAKTLRKPDVDAAVAKALNISKAAASDIVASIFEEIALGIAKDDAVQIASFGNFVKRHRSERNGRDPRSGQPIRIAAHATVLFRPASKFKAVVNDEPDC